MYRLELPWPDQSLVFEIPFAGLGPTWQAVALGAVTLVPLLLILWLLRNELRLVSRGTAFLLLVLRLALLAVILGLVCLQPRVVAQTRTEEPGHLVVLVDRSASMDLADAQRSLVDRLRLAKAMKLYEGLCSAEWVQEWLDDADGERPSSLRRPGEGKVYATLLSKVDTLPRSEVQRRILDRPGLDLLARLGSKHHVELFGFHRQTWRAEAKDIASVFTPAEGAAAGDALFTDIRQALAHANQAAGGTGNLLGIVLLTDGQHNLGDSPMGLVRDWQDKLPIYPIAIGSRTPPPDVAILAVQAPTRSLKDEDVSVRVQFRVLGQSAQDLKLSLHADGPMGKVLQERTIAHDGKKRDYEETFSVKLAEVGPKKIVAKITATKGEDVRPDNNVGSTDILVTDDKARVLLVDGEMRWESHYLATALVRDPKIRLRKVVFDQPRLDRDLTPAQMDELGLPRTRLPEGPDALNEFQCIILGDVTPEQLPLADRKRLERFVSERGGTLVLVAGKGAMPLGFPAKSGNEPDPLAKLLPLETMKALSIKEGFGVTRTTAGLEHRFLEMEPDTRDNDERWASFPPSYWAVVGKPKPGASILAAVTKSDPPGRAASALEKEQGLIVLQPYGLGRVLFVGLDSTWRWRFKVGDTYHHRFWGQAIRWAISEETLGTGNKYLRFGTQQPSVTRGQDVEIVLRLEEEAGALKPGSLVAARIVRKPANAHEKEEVVATVPLGAKPAVPRAYDGVVRDLPEGSYEVELVIPDLDPKMLLPDAEPGKEPAKGPLRSPFTVRPTTSREYLDLEVNEELLKGLASATGGRVHTPEDAEKLIEELRAKSIVRIDPPSDQPWYLGWWPLAIVLALLGGEWILRKRAGLP
jgi:hypothetical protein